MGISRMGMWQCHDCDVLYKIGSQHECKIQKDGAIGKEQDMSEKLSTALEKLGDYLSDQQEAIARSMS